MCANVLKVVASSRRASMMCNMTATGSCDKSFRAPPTVLEEWCSACALSTISISNSEQWLAVIRRFGCRLMPASGIKCRAKSCSVCGPIGTAALKESERPAIWACAGSTDARDIACANAVAVEAVRSYGGHAHGLGTSSRTGSRDRGSEPATALGELSGMAVGAPFLWSPCAAPMRS